jgi:predicted transposase/invertase (TIGR01784 family)
MKTIRLRPRLSRALKRLARKYAAMGKPLNVMVDIVFKALFTADDEDARAALRLLLSDCIHRPVQNVRIMNNELIPEYLTGKTVRLDIHVTFNDGEQSNLEMQVGRSQDDLKIRASIYAARLLGAQVKRGKQYREVKRVYQIFFLNCVLYPKSAKVPRRYLTLEETEHDRLNEVTEIILYEMPKLEEQVHRFLAGQDRLENLPKEQKWCIYFRYKQNEKLAPLITELCRQEEGIMRADRALKKMNRDYDHWARQLFREKAEMDYNSGMANAREEGLAKGRQEARLETAGKMKNLGLSVEQIAEVTGLSRKDIENL